MVFPTTVEDLRERWSEWLNEIEEEPQYEADLDEELLYWMTNSKNQEEEVTIGIESDLLTEGEDDATHVVIYQATESSFTRYEGNPIEKTALTQAEIAQHITKVKTLKLKGKSKKIQARYASVGKKFLKEFKKKSDKNTETFKQDTN